MKKRSKLTKSKINWIILGVGVVFIWIAGHLFSNDLNYYIIASTQSSFKPFAQVYLKTFYRINSKTRIHDQTPIQYAILSYGKLDQKKKDDLSPMITYFVSRGVDINANSDAGLTAIHYAIVNEDPFALNLLIEKGADVNAPIHFEEEVDNAKNAETEGMTPLKYLNYRVSEKKVKDTYKIALLETILKTVGAHE